MRFETHELFLVAKSLRALAREVFGCQLSQYTHPAEGCIRFTPRSMCFNYFICENLIAVVLLVFGTVSGITKKSSQLAEIKIHTGNRRDGNLGTKDNKNVTRITENCPI